jgi:hypothetical protein
MGRGRWGVPVDVIFLLDTDYIPEKKVSLLSSQKKILDVYSVSKPNDLKAINTHVDKN